MEQIVDEHRELIRHECKDHASSKNNSLIFMNLQMSYRESYKSRHSDTNKALLHEINLLDKREAIVPINRSDIPNNYPKIW